MCTSIYIYIYIVKTDRINHIINQIIGAGAAPRGRGKLSYLLDVICVCMYVCMYVYIYIYIYV